MDYDKITHETYERLFAKSTPKADFNELLKNARIDKEGQKHIDFMDYELSREEFEKTLTFMIDNYNIPDYKRAAFKTNIYLGCSPKFKE